MTTCRTRAVLVLVLLVQISTAYAKDDQIPGWYRAGSAHKHYRAALDRETKYSGANSAFLESLPSRETGFGCLNQDILAEPFRGRRIQYRAFVTTSNVIGKAGLWMRVDDAAGKSLAFDNMQARPITGDTSWAAYEIDLDVPSTAERITYGLILSGSGAAWIDHIELARGTNPVPDGSMETWILSNDTSQNPRNLDFEEPTSSARPLDPSLLRYPSGEGGDKRALTNAPDEWFFGGTAPLQYDFGLDRSGSHGGGACLRISSRPTYEHGYGTVHQWCYADVWRERNVKLSGFLRGSNVTGIAELWIRADDKHGSTVAFDSMQKQGTALSGTGDWIPCEVSITVPRQAEELRIGFVLSGAGAAWVDDLEVEAAPTAGEDRGKLPPEDGFSNLAFEDGPMHCPERDREKMQEIKSVRPLPPAKILLAAKEAWTTNIPGAESVAAGDWDGDGESEIFVSDKTPTLHVLSHAGVEKATFDLPRRFTWMEIGCYGDEPRLLGYRIWKDEVVVLDPRGKTVWTCKVMNGLDGAHWGDVDGDGRDEMIVGGNARGGLQLLSADGECIWMYRRIKNVWNQVILPVAGKQPAFIAATSADGRVRMFDERGRVLNVAKPEDFYFCDLYGSRAGLGGAVQLLAVAVASIQDDESVYGRGILLAMDETGMPLWRAPFTASAWGSWTLRFITSGDLNGDGMPEWVVRDRRDGLSVISGEGRRMVDMDCPVKEFGGIAVVQGQDGFGQVVVLDGGNVHSYRFVDYMPQSKP